MIFQLIIIFIKMENKKEEEKFDPSLDLAKVLQELGLDPKSDDFTKEKMITRFQEEIKNPAIDHW